MSTAPSRSHETLPRSGSGAVDLGSLLDPRPASYREPPRDLCARARRASALSRPKINNVAIGADDLCAGGGRVRALTRAKINKRGAAHQRPGGAGGARPISGLVVPAGRGRSAAWRCRRVARPARAAKAAGDVGWSGDRCSAELAGDVGWSGDRRGARPRSGGRPIRELAVIHRLRGLDRDVRGDRRRADQRR